MTLSTETWVKTKIRDLKLLLIGMPLIKDFTLALSGNIGFNKTEIQSLGIMNDFGYETYWTSSEIGYDY